MKNKIDKMLNEYLDGEIDSNKLKILEEEINKDAKTLSDLRLMRFIEDTIKNSELESASEDTTAQIMNKIYSSSRKRNDGKYFTWVLTTLLTGIIGTITYLVVQSMPNNESSLNFNFFYELINSLSGSSSKMFSFFSNSNVSIIVIGLTLLLLIYGYVLFDAHKDFKKTLNTFSN